MAPILLAVGFILNLYLGNVTELDLPILVVPIAAALVISLGITVAAGGIFRNRTKGLIFGSIFVAAFFALGTLPIVGAGVILGSFIFLLKTQRGLKEIQKYLVILAVIVFGVAVGRVVIEEVGKMQSEARNPLVLPTARKTGNTPDIYYIVPDSYSASSSLLKYYNYDNKWFENDLSNMGFYEATQSASNYPKTFLSLGSSLNMEYLDFLSKNKESKNLSLVDPLIENNNVVKFLTGIGYKYYHLGSWWGATHTNKNATENIILENKKGVPISQFDYIVLESTMAQPIIDKLLPKITVGDSDTDRMDRANYQFEKLVEVAKKPGPKFIFAHIIAPHEPYFYGKNCEFVSLLERKKIKEEVKYVNHLNCVNKKLEEAVQGIIKNSKTPPIIVIQSDEGAPFLAEEMSPPDSWGEASNSLLREKFFVFNAYLLPGVKESELWPSITPVNSFRFIFNHYFGTNMEILPDKSYILPDLKHLYDFIDVTDTIRQPGV